MDLVAKSIKINGFRRILMKNSDFIQNPGFRDQNIFKKKTGIFCFSYIFIVLGENKFSLQYVVKIPSGAGDTPIATSSKVDAILQITSFRVTSFRSQLSGTPQWPTWDEVFRKRPRK